VKFRLRPLSRGGNSDKSDQTKKEKGVGKREPFLRRKGFLGLGGICREKLVRF